MLNKEEYLKMISYIPIPYVYIEMDEINKIKVIDINKRFNELIGDKIIKGNIYSIDNIGYKEAFLEIDRHIEDKIKKIYIKDIKSFYEIEIIKISENRYLIWFKRKIDIDKNIKELMNGLGGVIWLKDRDGRHVYTNKDITEGKYTTIENMIGKTDEEIFPEEVANLFSKGEKTLIKQSKEFSRGLVSYDGKFYNGFVKLIKDENKEILGTIGICLEVIENIEYNNQLSAIKMLNLISDNIPDSIFLKDKHGVFRHCNKVFAENRNMTKEDIIGKTEKDINTPHDKIKKYEIEEKNIMKTKSKLISNNSSISDDGRVRYFETVKVPMLDSNKVVSGVLGISRDISHRKEAELEFESLRMEFFANLSHEFKTPLNLIFSSIQLMEAITKRNNHDEEYKKYTNIIRQNSYRLLKMVNNLIDSTRLNAGCLEYNPQNYNIVEFIENICDSVQSYAKEEGIKLIFDTNVEEKIMAFDLEKMDRIILNLLSNAIKYNTENGIIYVKLDIDDKNLNMSIKDSGIGIPKDKLEEVFTLFKQVNNRITKPSEGSGIGLSIVKSLVDLHGGTIKVDSEEKVGSEFKIVIPIRLCEENYVSQNAFKYNKYVENIDIEFSDIYTSVR
ncbi:ATP-binding protein [Romboutsia hominis]|uniref:sensor histidine kinase n=1 Tax=Romboutsia hominis TaxID=1507512 RepID=UPI001F05E63B|nr:ATP-binding protein [Romboutsia hominis]MCH1960596.1 ATP-binding protein [Romboutsia hominis]MCH1968972.1 ATP-binding protein [Romboutsia hominis]